MAGNDFTAEERAAMKERAAEASRAKSRGSGAKKAAADLQDVLDKIADMTPEDRGIAEALHEVVTTEAPDLAPRTWYGMPAYARDGKVLLFFKAASKFKTRYAELGFNESAALDDGDMWPTAYAVTAMNEDMRARLVELVRRAVRGSGRQE